MAIGTSPRSGCNSRRFKLKAKCTRIVNGVEVECSPTEAEFVTILLPQPEIDEFTNHGLRKLPVIIKGQRHETSCWSWNGDVDRPTFKPSLLTKIEYTDPSRKDFCCHSFVTDGMVQFLGDSSHEYASKTMELLDFPVDTLGG